jgi:hypothetical protein
MILDRQNLFSSAQALTSTGAAASTDIIDLGSSRDIGAGEILEIIAEVDTTFTSGGSATLVVALQTDTSSGFGSAVTLATGSTIAVAQLSAGAELAKFRIPRGVLRYLRLVYTVGTAAMTAGSVTAGVVLSRQDSAVYASSIVVA